MQQGRFARVEAAFAPVLLFVAIYCVVFAVATAISGTKSQAVVQWEALAAVVVSSITCRYVFGVDQARTRMALPLAIACGVGVPFALLGTVDTLILLTADFRHVRGSGVSVIQIATLMLPAALHEELLFRGFAFRRISTWNTSFAVAFTSIMFALLHGSNSGVGAVAFVNIALGGVLLALVVLFTGRLSAAMAMHFVWNVISGPILGHEVSGFMPERSLLQQVDRGPALLTGGAFGIEASIWLTAAELIGCAYLIWLLRKSRWGLLPSST